jgi:FdhD protein
MAMPILSNAQAPLTETITVVNEHGDIQSLDIPAERALTVYVDKQELVTLMTLGARPEQLVLGYLRNQRLVDSVDDVASITVDWEVGAAAVHTRGGIARWQERTARRVVTTGCGQGSMFAELMDQTDALQLPATRITQSELYSIVNQIRLMDSVYKQAGSVHGCALFVQDRLLTFVEDVGRHNAIDTIAGWQWLQEAQTLRPVGQLDAPTLGHVFYTTGRMTSEMVIKAAQMGVAVLISRSGITHMGLTIARQLGLCTIGRATNRRFLCFSAPERLQLQPELFLALQA